MPGATWCCLVGFPGACWCPVTTAQGYLVGVPSGDLSNSVQWCLLPIGAQSRCPVPDSAHGAQCPLCHSAQNPVVPSKVVQCSVGMPSFHCPLVPDGVCCPLPGDAHCLVEPSVHWCLLLLTTAPLSPPAPSACQCSVVPSAHWCLLLMPVVVPTATQQCLGTTIVLKFHSCKASKFC